MASHLSAEDRSGSLILLPIGQGMEVWFGWRRFGLAGGGWFGWILIRVYLSYVDPYYMRLDYQLRPNCVDHGNIDPDYYWLILTRLIIVMLILNMPILI
jgi:hypothetical protein